ncbi:MAG TPA: MarR family transcriptional regulator, partial [Acidimicrobiales bacterium]|nr:MarR family transcriptional regulator [Acidimicrobiales bacterium]
FPGTPDAGETQEAAASHRGGWQLSPLGDRMRAFSLEAGFYLHAVADRLGMTATDFTCLTVLLNDGPASAGELAERAGLTSGAVTGLVDRLERGGWVRRVPDPADRRRVIVEPLLHRRADLLPLVGSMRTSAARLEAALDPEQQELVGRFVDQCTELLRDEIHRLKGAPAGQPDTNGDGPQPAGPPGVVRVPKTGLATASLVVRGIATDVRLAADDLGDDLCVVDFAGRPPIVSAEAQRVEVVHRRLRDAWRWRDRRGSILLDRAVAWDIAVSGGASNLDIDLCGARLAGLAISGGASTVELALPAPSGRLPVRLSGGASTVRVNRPKGVPVAVRVRGGAMSVELDGHRVESVAGTSTFGDQRAPDGYDIDISGGASTVEIRTA